MAKVELRTGDFSRALWAYQEALTIDRQLARAAGNTEWWRWQHDEHNSGRYGTVTRAPGAVRGLSWRPGRATATFTAPGDTWYSGAGPASYRVTAWPSGRTATVPATADAGARQTVPVPRGTWRLTVQAVSTTGLKGLPTTRD